MKLLIIWHAGGVESYRQRIIELAKKFSHVTMLVPERWNEGGKIVTAKQEMLTLNCNIVTGKTIWNFHGSTYVYTNSLFKVLKDYKPDIIHIHEEPWSLSTFQAIVYAELLKLRSRIIIDSAAINTNKKPVFSNIENYIYKKSDLFFARNNEVVSVLRERGCKSPIYLLPNGVDTSLFKRFNDATINETRQNLNVEPGQFLVGYMGRMIQEKGIFDFIDAAAFLINNGLTGLKFIMIGNGPEQSNAAAYIDQRNLSSHFILMEKVNSSDVPLYMNAIDTLVLPSRTTQSWKEQFGRVLVEAMACGKPVIGSSSGAIPEVINNKDFIFSEGNSLELAAIIKKLLEDKQTRNEAFNNSANRVENLYSWKALSSYYLDTLQKQKLTNG